MCLQGAYSQHTHCDNTYMFFQITENRILNDTLRKCAIYTLRNNVIQALMINDSFIKVNQLKMQALFWKPCEVNQSDL